MNLAGWCSQDQALRGDLRAWQGTEGGRGGLPWSCEHSFSGSHRTPCSGARLDSYPEWDKELGAFPPSSSQSREMGLSPGKYGFGLGPSFQPSPIPSLAVNCQFSTLSVGLFTSAMGVGTSGWYLGMSATDNCSFIVWVLLWGWHISDPRHTLNLSSL